MILILFLLLLLLIEILCGYQVMAFLFANNPEIYLKKIDKIELNMEYFILGLAIVGILQTLLTCYLYNNHAATFAKLLEISNTRLTEAKTLYGDEKQALENTSNALLVTATAAKPSNAFFMFLIVFVLASFGINGYLLFVFSQIIKGEIKIDNDNETLKQLKILIPSSIGLCFIFLILGFYYIQKTQ
jgi:hypothetical protein